MDSLGGAQWDGYWLAHLAGEVAAFRYLLVSLALLWAFLQIRRRAPWAFVGGVLFVGLALAFWTVSLRRPYGFLVDQAATAAMADAAVTAASHTPRSLLALLEPEPGWRTGLTRCGVPLSLTLQVPLLVPAIVLPALAALALFLARSRDEGAIAMTLLLLGLTGDMDTLHGVGFLSGLWAHPMPAGLLVVVVGIVAGLARRQRASWSLAGALCGFVLTLFAQGTLSPTRLATVLELLVPDQGLWLVLAVWGASRLRDHAALGLVAVGAAGLVLHAFAPERAPDPWLAHACYRAGLILASVPAVSIVIHAIGERLKRVPALRLYDGQGLGLAALVLVLAPLSFPAWWEPTKLDATAAGSREAPSRFLADAVAWIASSTKPGDVFVAPGEYAAWISVAAGRQVLRAPDLRVAPDDAIRLQVESRILRGRPLPAWATRYNVRYVVYPPEGLGFERAPPLADLLRQPGYRLRFTDRRGLAIVEVEQGVYGEEAVVPRVTRLAPAVESGGQGARSCAALQAS